MCSPKDQSAMFHKSVLFHFDIGVMQERCQVCFMDLVHQKLNLQSRGEHKKQKNYKGNEDNKDK